MVKLKVSNFGPVRAGLGDFIEFAKVTLFCGPQGSGKSTVAKLFSTLSWVEKKLFRLCYPKVMTSYHIGMLLNDLSWQGIADYLTADSRFEFIGDFYRIAYQENGFQVEQLDESREYEMPQIMYMPAERNFASIVRNALRVENLPESLVNLQVEFERAKKMFHQGYKLPANGFRFTFDVEKGESWIQNGNASASKTPLHLASSGLQSMVPLLLVSECLESRLSRNEIINIEDPFRDAAPQRRIDAERFFSYVKSLGLNRELESEAIARYLMPCTRFLNIVEEPEQNLYPDTQCEVVDRILALANRCPSSRLVMSTHSPYIVNHLQLVAQAEEVVREAAGKVDIKFPINMESLVPSSDIRLYEMHMDGSMSLSQSEDGYISDSNSLNLALADFNERYAQILEAGRKDV